jgi:hypothetical protein
MYQEFLRSRHAATSWAAIYGEKGLKPDQGAFSEQWRVIGPSGLLSRNYPLGRLGKKYIGE